MELKSALIDPGSSLNIMPLPTLEEIRIPWSKNIEQPIEASGFGGKASFIFDLTVGPIRVARLHDISASPRIILLLERTWIHKHNVVLCTYHLCLKALWKVKKVNVNVF